MIRLSFLAIMMTWVMLTSLLPSSAHTTVGTTDVYRCGWGTIAMIGGFGVVLGGFAWYVWRRKKDNLGLIFLIAIPAFGYVFLPELLTTRLEVSPTHLVHYRKILNGKVDVNVAFADVSAAYEIQRVNANDGKILAGYVLGVKGGAPIEIPTNEVVTGGRERINARLTAAGLQVKPVQVRSDEEHHTTVDRLMADLYTQAHKK